MQQRCPIQDCGRIFENEMTMLEHVKRRHPQQSQKIREQTTNEMLQKQNRISEEISKLPKMQKVIQMSREKRPVEFHRRSSSKNKKLLTNPIQATTGKISQIINESRQLVEENGSSRKLLKRPSLSKKTAQDTDKLPALGQPKAKKLKLESLKSQLNSSTITKKSQMQKLTAKNESLLVKQSQATMYSTAPYFTQQMTKKIELIRARGKIDSQLSNRSSSKDINQLNALTTDDATQLLYKKRLSSQTIETVAQTDNSLEGVTKPIQRPVKRLLQRSVKKDNAHSMLINKEDLAQSAFIDMSQFMIEPKKQLTFQPNKRPLSRDDHKFTNKQMFPQATSSFQSSFKDNPSFLEQFNWQQRTVSIRSNSLMHLRIPQHSEVEHLYIIGCDVKTVDLNECFSLISLSLAHNSISGLSFLEPTPNGAYQNLQALYLDHNSIRSLDTLPTYLQLRRLSLAFNKVQSLDDLLRVLVRLPLLEELDLSFNPVRKQTNYKLAVLAACKGLKMLDGMLVTKFDRQMASEYHKIYFDCLHILPLSYSPISQDKLRPSTAVSVNYQQELQSSNAGQLTEMTEQELTIQIQTLQKMIKTTKDQLEIIQQENNALEQEIQSYQGDLNCKDSQKQDEFNPKVYQKLCREVEELEMLNFLQHASEKQLQQILVKKITQKGLTPQLLAAN